jgi:hypothetical protein
MMRMCSLEAGAPPSPVLGHFPPGDLRDAAEIASVNGTHRALYSVRMTAFSEWSAIAPNAGRPAGNHGLRTGRRHFRESATYSSCGFLPDRRQCDRCAENPIRRREEEASGLIQRYPDHKTLYHPQRTCVTTLLRVPAGSVDAGHLCPHRPQVGRKLAAVMRAVFDHEG